MLASVGASEREETDETTALCFRVSHIVERLHTMVMNNYQW